MHSEAHDIAATANMRSTADNPVECVRSIIMMFSMETEAVDERRLRSPEKRHRL